MKCKDCGYYELFKLVTSDKPFSYSEDIPCFRCIHFNDRKSDEFVPMGTTEFERRRNEWMKSTKI